MNDWKEWISDNTLAMLGILTALCITAAFLLEKYLPLDTTPPKLIPTKGTDYSTMSLE